MFILFSEHNPSGVPLYQPSYPDAPLRCSHCCCSFSNREEQLAHYRLDWHRFNVKRSLDDLPPVTQENFADGNLDERPDSDGKTLIRK